jgi:endonuclease/exonuclease/phosphatase family metal-dependent hydrolase
MTLNIAHGRGDSFHQLLQRSATTVANLDAIATLLRDSGADVVALQEADGPSFWSGNFSHIDYLADNGSFSQSVHGAHVDGMGLSYGTALIANLDLKDPKAITFDPALSPVPKGFVVSTISWPGRPDIDVDIVSVHLDFASRAIRKKQAMELIETLRDRLLSWVTLTLSGKRIPPFSTSARNLRFPRITREGQVWRPSPDLANVSTGYWCHTGFHSAHTRWFRIRCLIIVA